MQSVTTGARGQKKLVISADAVKEVRAGAFYGQDDQVRPPNAGAFHGSEVRPPNAGMFYDSEVRPPNAG